MAIHPTPSPLNTHPGHRRLTAFRSRASTANLRPRDQTGQRITAHRLHCPSINIVGTAHRPRRESCDMFRTRPELARGHNITARTRLRRPYTPLLHHGRRRSMMCQRAREHGRVRHSRAILRGIQKTAPPGAVRARLLHRNVSRHSRAPKAQARLGGRRGRRAGELSRQDGRTGARIFPWRFS